MQVNISNKASYTVLFVILLIAAFVVVSAYTNIPNPGHGGDQVIITVNGVEKPLQEAIDDGSLGGTAGSTVKAYHAAGGEPTKLMVDADRAANLAIFGGGRCRSNGEGTECELHFVVKKSDGTFIDEKIGPVVEPETGDSSGIFGTTVVPVAEGGQYNVTMWAAGKAAFEYARLTVLVTQ